jgi:hypothetical protein
MPIPSRLRVFHRALEKGSNAEGDGNGDEKALHGAKGSGRCPDEVAGGRRGP